MEKSWGVGLADIDKDGVLDIGVAFGDVLSPKWRSGPTTKIAEKGKEDDKKKDEKPAERKSPERGMFGSINVWRGELHK